MPYKKLFSFRKIVFSWSEENRFTRPICFLDRNSILSSEDRKKNLHLRLKSSLSKLNQQSS